MYLYGYHLIGTINENNFIKSTGNLENFRYLLIKINSYYKKLYTMYFFFLLN